MFYLRARTYTHTRAHAQTHEFLNRTKTIGRPSGYQNRLYNPTSGTPTADARNEIMESYKVRGHALNVYDARTECVKYT